MRSNELSTIALSITVFTLIAVTPAVARIECRDNFQVTKHGLISTPYCEEKQIARVARSSVSPCQTKRFATIPTRRSISAKSSVTISG